MLSSDDFSAFFHEIHGYEPFPWQSRLVNVVSGGKWPPVLDLPTGAGKTAAIDVAVFHLALEADRAEARRAPVRIAFVVDRRLIVDDAYERAKKIATALADAKPGTVLARVAGRLQRLSVDGKPLLVRRLRGGIPREDDWARTPSQPTVLCSTVDQVGSRLLFRGYGVSDSMKPVHAGLLGSDCLILLDEAHLAAPFRQTLASIKEYRSGRWCNANHVGPWDVALLTATPGAEAEAEAEAESTFQLHAEDRNHPVLKRRLEAKKIARLVCCSRAADSEDNGAAQLDDEQLDAKNDDHRVEAVINEVRRALSHFQNEANGAPKPAIGVVVNRVFRARRIFDRIRQTLREESGLEGLANTILMIGPARPLDRDALATELGPIRTKMWKAGERRSLDRTLIVVATQCIEAGVDIDLDALITEAAALDALRQRFGRLNRAGRDMVPYAAVVAVRGEIQVKYNDPVYGTAIKYTWDRLVEAASAEVQGKKEKIPLLDFGLSSFSVAADPETLARTADAPILLPAHLDLLSQTSPIPAASPDISLYLHGAERPSDSITVVWRADIEHRLHSEDGTRTLLKLVPPRSAEAVELPLWAVRRWLEEDLRSVSVGLADVAGRAPEERFRKPRPDEVRLVFRWKGDDALSTWIRPGEIRVGDTVIVPASCGGLDEFGWDPKCKRPSQDLGREAADPFTGSRFAIRIAPGLYRHVFNDAALASALASAESQRWRDVREAVRSLPLPADILSDLRRLDAARQGRVTCDIDLYGVDESGHPRGVVFSAPFGVKDAGSEQEDEWQNATEDDVAGSLPGFSCPLSEHSAEVQQRASTFAESAGFSSDRITDLKVAGFLHDAGKADSRFQAWLHYDDPLGGESEDSAQLLAKSERPLPRAAHRASGLPDRWRHEALSVRLAVLTEATSNARDPELVLWLIGTHHGHGRPFFPHADPADGQVRCVTFIDGRKIQLPAGPGPQSPAFDWKGDDWPALFERLKARYGAWELARMEATLRLADHRASQDAKDRRAKRGPR